MSREPYENISNSNSKFAQGISPEEKEARQLKFSNTKNMNRLLDKKTSLSNYQQLDGFQCEDQKLTSYTPHSQTLESNSLKTVLDHIKQRSARSRSGNRAGPVPAISSKPKEGVKGVKKAAEKRKRKVVNPANSKDVNMNRLSTIDKIGGRFIDSLQQKVSPKSQFKPPNAMKSSPGKRIDPKSSS